MPRVARYPDGADGFAVHQNAVVVPPHPIAFGHFRTGVLSAMGERLRIPVLFTSSESLFVRTPNATDWRLGQQRFLPGRYLWGGACFYHFGHFLTETFPYLVSVADSLNAWPDLRIAVLRRPEYQVGFHGLHEWFVRRIGLSLDRIVPVDVPSRIEELHIPPDPFRRRHHYTLETLRLLDRLAFAPPRPNGERLFLSRRQLDRKYRELPEIAAIEALFAGQGFRIIHPECLALDDQASLILGAREIAGENGSALHWSLLSPHIRRVISLGWAIKLQAGICRSREQELINIRRPLIGPLLPRRQSVPVGLVRRRLQVIDKRDIWPPCRVPSGDGGR